MSWLNLKGEPSLQVAYGSDNSRTAFAFLSRSRVMRHLPVARNTALWWQHVLTIFRTCESLLGCRYFDGPTLADGSVSPRTAAVVRLAEVRSWPRAASQAGRLTPPAT